MHICNYLQMISAYDMATILQHHDIIIMKFDGRTTEQEGIDTSDI